MSEPKWEQGEHVVANFGAGDIVAHYWSGPHQNGEEVKHKIQDEAGKHKDLGYREPADYDDKGSGGTFRKV